MNLCGNDMRQTITKTEKNIMFLNKIIVEGFYKGFIENDKFELMRNNFPNNHRIMGNLNENGSYVLKFDYKSPMNFLAKLLFCLGILVSIISLIFGFWILPIVFLFFFLIVFADFKLKEKKEINLLLEKLLDFQKKLEE